MSLQVKIISTFKNEKHHQDTLSFMLGSSIGTFIKLQSNDNINELAVLLEQYHQYKLKS